MKRTMNHMLASGDQGADEPWCRILGEIYDVLPTLESVLGVQG
ncbi:hypothetical protein D791_00179 [Nitrincola nitratireducens]|uniref:Uncharacterized protein n=1 Tax=Nitrincola nitratireducens TaxID=1229521 RepID=W9V9Y3_9GAMM|nr:hypothetical protein D791_00179 [Nitrincola nitratireducens]